MKTHEFLSIGCTQGCINVEPLNNNPYIHTPSHPIGKEAAKRFAEGTIDPETAKAYRKKLREAQHELKVFVNEHNEVLHRDYSREKVYSGNDVSFSAKPGKDDNAMANLSYIDSQEYADKFKGKYANEQVEKSVVSACRQVVKNRNGTFYEEAYFIDANTGKTFSYVKGKYKNGIVMPEVLKKRLTVASKNSIIMIHNHPNSSPLSTDDYNSSAKYDSLFEVIASGHNGDVYVFRDTFGTEGAMNKYSDGIEECQTVRDFRIAFTKEKIRNGLDEFEARNKAWKNISMLRGFFYEKR